jgi:hypothetical protein
LVARANKAETLALQSDFARRGGAHDKYVSPERLKKAA